MTPAEGRFKSAVLALVWDGVYPGPVQITRRLGHERPCQTINGREMTWRAEVLRELGWTARRWPHRRRHTWVPPQDGGVR